MNNRIFILLLAACPTMLMPTQQNTFLKAIDHKLSANTTAYTEQHTGQSIERKTSEASNLEAFKQKQLSWREAPGDTTIKGDMYLKYDFVPGQQVLYNNDFAAENMGELPTGWNTNGNGAVVTLDLSKGNWLQFYQNTSYLTDNTALFTENFTVEFDLALRQTNPKAAFPELTLGVLSSGSLASTHNDLLRNYAAGFATELNMQPADHIRSSIQLQTLAGGKPYLKTDLQRPGMLLHPNQVIHVAMHAQKERLRIWFNGQKLYDLPKAIAPGTAMNQLYFVVKRYGGPEQEVGYAISNIKIAKGAPDTRSKLLDEGRFSTTGILFAVNSATIIPASNGVLGEIAGILTKNPDLKIKIIGHTDSDGAEAANLNLSQKRAVAVKQALVTSFGIDGSRIETDGAGETKPVGNNNTREGKANNRRVEFIKIK